MDVLGMFARRPELGKAKTRLAATIGPQLTLELYTAFLEDLLQMPAARSEDFFLAVTPSDEPTHRWFESRAAHAAEICEQPAGNLGHRIRWFFESAFKRGAERAVLIGSDSPDLPAETIDSAFDSLRSHDMVLAPAADGGYVLVGLSKPPGLLFDHVSWSSAATLVDTMLAAERCGLTLKLLRPWYDIDTVENLGALLAMQRVPDTPARPCPQTQACLEAHWEEIAAVANRPDSSQPSS